MQTHNYLNQLNKGQYEAATTIQGPVRILAGAGSGKTHTLISRVAYMIDCGISPEQILLLTFTNNAAKNMVEILNVQILLPVHIIHFVRSYCANMENS